VAEAANHHPDIAIHWNEVTLTLWTHTAGAITDADRALATQLDAVLDTTDLPT
jgi:4a-hydroxytetrahydrobiopterin dehydratase